MASGNNASDLHERLDSHVWWKVKTGWTDAQYMARKNALLMRVREEWPQKKMRPTRKDIIDGIESLVATFDDRAWCLKTGDDPVLRFEEQLRLYSKWAALIHLERVRIPEDKLYDTSTATSARAKEAIFDTEHSFDWEDVEVILDVQFWAHLASTPMTGIFHLPMTDFRNTDPAGPLHWNEFSWDNFHAQVKKLIGYSETAPLFVYWIRDGHFTHLRHSGDYRIMLKRFSETCESSHTINLLITEHDNPIRMKPELAARPLSLARHHA